ncbi:T9SS type B sorting domain-containing protein [Nonlabens sp. Asnod2-A12]|uniref:T9SS type B sorting domain-containing protein n=1 Tax=Nonlabens sp. Asnod2-A12 TaxID=3160578 RepID=UPI00386A2386
MKKLLFFCFIILSATFVNAQAVNTAYLCLSNGDVVLADLSSCSSTVVATNTQPMFDIAQGDSATTLYGIYDTELYLIDLNTGNFTLLGSLTIIGHSGSFRVDSLVKEQNGVLLGVNKNGQGELFRIDVAALTATNLGATGFNSAGDLTYFDGDLYLSATNSELVQVNVANPSASFLIGSMASSGFGNVFGVVTIITANPCSATPTIELVATGGRTTKFVDVTNGNTTNNCTSFSPSDIFGAAEVTSDILCPINVEIIDTTRMSPDPTSYCSQATTTLSANADPTVALGTYSYEWREQGNTAVIGTNMTLPIMINTTTVYECTITDSGIAPPDNFAVDAITIIVDPMPTWAPLGSIYANANYTLPGITGTNVPANSAYYTGPNGTGTQYNIGDVVTELDFITNPVTLYIYGDETNGCEITGQFDLEFVDVQLTITPGGIQDICAGETVTLTATPTPATAYGTYTYNWTDSQNTVYPNTDTIVFTATVDTTVAVMVNDSGVENGVDMGFDMTDFNVLTPVDITAITDQTATSTFTFPTINGTGLTTAERYYTQPNGMGTVYDAGDIVNASDFTTLPVTLYMYDTNGACEDQESFVLNFDTPISLTVSINATANDFCAGEITNLTATPNPAMAQGTYTYQWVEQGTTAVLSTGNTLTVTPLVNTVYECTVTDSGLTTNNTATSTITINVIDVPVIDVINNQNSTTTFTFPTITGMNLSGNEMFFTQPDGLGTAYNAGDVIDRIEFASYPVTIYAYDVNASGCSDQVSFNLVITEDVIIPEPEVELFHVPDYMTPNNDGYHDYWQIEVFEPSVQFSNIYIFDRYGKLLKQLSIDGPGWDATYNNNPLPSSSYWYSFEYTYDGVTVLEKGFFAVKR